MTKSKKQYVNTIRNASCSMCDVSYRTKPKLASKLLRMHMKLAHGADEVKFNRSSINTMIDGSSAPNFSTVKEVRVQVKSYHNEVKSNLM